MLHCEKLISNIRIEVVRFRLKLIIVLLIPLKTPKVFSSIRIILDETYFKDAFDIRVIIPQNSNKSEVGRRYLDPQL